MRTLIDIPEDDIRWLDCEARHLGKSRAAIVREAVSAYRADAGKDWIARGAGYWKGRDDIDWLFERAAAITELSQCARPRISRVVWTEILAGEPPATRDAVRDLLRPFEIVEIDERIAAAAADIRHATRMKLLDAIILATARINDAVLVTRNTKDFPATMPGVRVPYTL